MVAEISARASVPRGTDLRGSAPAGHHSDESQYKASFNTKDNERPTKRVRHASPNTALAPIGTSVHYESQWRVFGFCPS